MSGFVLPEVNETCAKLYQSFVKFQNILNKTEKFVSLCIGRHSVVEINQGKLIKENEPQVFCKTVSLDLAGTGVKRKY